VRRLPEEVRRPDRQRGQAAGPQPGAAKLRPGGRDDHESDRDPEDQDRGKRPIQKADPGDHADDQPPQLLTGSQQPDDKVGDRDPHPRSNVDVTTRWPASSVNRRPPTAEAVRTWAKLSPRSSRATRLASSPVPSTASMAGILNASSDPCPSDPKIRASNGDNGPWSE